MSKVMDFIGSAVRIFDGATGTMLFSLGYKGDGCPEKVDPGLIAQVHMTHLEAGSDFVTTNTFGANRAKLSKYNIGDQVTQINLANAAIAKNLEFDSKYYVAGDIGPTGELPQPLGTFGFDEFYEVFTEQVKALVEGGVDLIIIETMTDVEELRAAIRAAKKNSDLPVIACMTFSETPRGPRTMMGVDVATAVAAMIEEDVDVVGTNCTITPDQVVPLLEELKSRTDKPILVQPNAGLPKMVDGQTVYEPIENLERHIAQIKDAGAQIIGGCCGTDGDYIRAVAKVCGKRW